MKKSISFLLPVLFIGFFSCTPTQEPASPTEKPAFNQEDFMGMWTLDIDVQGGGVGWFELHQNQGFLDADLLWRGGSVLPVANVYFDEDGRLILTRVQEVNKTKEGEGSTRKHMITHQYQVSLTSDSTLQGVLANPKADGSGMEMTAFKGTKLPQVQAKPDLSTVKYGDPVPLFNSKDLTGWKLLDEEHVNGFKVVDGVLVNDPVQEEGKQHVHYGNLRTEQVFEDFNLKLEVNVPPGNNSGVYLRGMYEVQVLDSYGKELDSHNMGAVYSRIKPSVAAEKPAGEWQSLDITLCDRHATVKLNGTTIIDNQPLYGPTGGAIIADVFAPGPIYLQGDHGKVSYRNIVLTPIID